MNNVYKEENKIEILFVFLYLLLFLPPFKLRATLLPCLRVCLQQGRKQKLLSKQVPSWLEVATPKFLFNKFRVSNLVTVYQVARDLLKLRLQSNRNIFYICFYSHS